MKDGWCVCVCKWNCGVGVSGYGKLVQTESRFGARGRTRRVIREGKHLPGPVSSAGHTVRNKTKGPALRGLTFSWGSRVGGVWL